MCQRISPLLSASCGSETFEAHTLTAADSSCVACRQLLKNGKERYSAALAPLPGSNAGGSGNCSVKWNQSKGKLKVKVYLFGQTQTTGVSLNQVGASIGGTSAAPQLVVQQVRAAVGTEVASGCPCSRSWPSWHVQHGASSGKVLAVSASSSTCGQLGLLGRDICVRMCDLQLMDRGAVNGAFACYGLGKAW